MGEIQSQPFQLSFNASLEVDFEGSRVTSDGGLVLVRELDEQIGFGELIEQHLRIGKRSLTSLQQRLVKTGGRLVKHAYYWLLLAESHLTRRLFANMVRRIAPKAKVRFKQRVRELTWRTQGVSLEEMVRELLSYLRGRRSDFGFCQTPWVLVHLDSWIRRRLRSVL